MKVPQYIVDKMHKIPYYQAEIKKQKKKIDTFFEEKRKKHKLDKLIEKPYSITDKMFDEPYLHIEVGNGKKISIKLSYEFTQTRKRLIKLIEQKQSTRKEIETFFLKKGIRLAELCGGITDITGDTFPAYFTQLEKGIDVTDKLIEFIDQYF